MTTKQTYDVFTVVRIRVKTTDQNRAESTVLDLLDNHLGDMLDCPAVVETGVELRADNPRSEEVKPNDCAESEFVSDLTGEEEG